MKIVWPVQAHPAPLVTWHKGEEAVDYKSTRGSSGSPVFSRGTQEEDKSLVRSVGSDLTLGCSATGFSQPSVSWYKDDTLLRGTSGDKIHLSRNQSNQFLIHQNIK